MKPKLLLFTLTISDKNQSCLKHGEHGVNCSHEDSLARICNPCVGIFLKHGGHGEGKFKEIV